MYLLHGKRLGQALFLMHLAFVVSLITFSPSFASDDPYTSNKIPAFERPQGGAGSGQTIWHKDVNSGCSYSDHDIYIDIDVDPALIKDAKIKMSNWDVDYNDPQSCAKGPEVDYLYINDTRIGQQLQGANNSWSVNEFNIPAGVLKKGQNHIHVDTDAPGTGCWCLGIGYVDIMGVVGFKIINYTPRPSAENVLWNDPGIMVEFSNEVKDTSITGETIKLDYRDQAGTWKEVPTTLKLTTATRVTVTPTGDLRDGVKYRMRVMSGPNGVKDKHDNELDATKEWPFWTMVNLDGQTANVYKPNTTKDKLQITWFNVLRNVDMVQNKPVANRIYVLWDEKADVHKDDQAVKFNANVTLSGQTKSNVTIKRPDKYTDDEKKDAKNTINFYHMAGGAGTEEYKLKVEPVPQTGTKSFEKEATATVRGSPKELTTEVYACEMAGWAGGAVAAELANAMSTFRAGVRYTEEVFPISYFTYSDKGAIKYAAGGFNMVYKNMAYSAWLDNACNQNTTQGNNATCEQLRMVEVDQGGVKVTRPEYEVVVDYMANLQRAGSNNFTVGLLPRNAVPTTAGSADSCITGLSNSAAHVILLLNENFNPSTLAHEIGHEFGLAVTTGAGCTNMHNNNGREIEGFRVLSGKNKSFTEGNGEYAKTNIADCDKVAYDTPVVPVMYQSAQDPKFRWMRKDDYESLLGKFTGASGDPLLDEGGAASGDWMVVQGYVDSSGTLTYYYSDIYLSC